MLVSVLLLGALGGGLAMTYAEQDRLEAPTAVSAKPLSPNSVQIGWAGSENVDSYVVTVGQDRALTTAVSTEVPATGTQVTLTDVTPTTPGTDRFFRVDAVRDGEVRSSRTGRFALVPGPVRGVKVTAASAGGFRAEWKPVDNARQFDITIARNKSLTKAASTVRTVGGATELVSKGLQPATKYWFGVRGVNGDQIGEPSKPVAFRTGVRESSFRVATWNVCSEKCSGYAGRARTMAQFLNANEVDIFGLQEAGGVRVGAVTNSIFSGGSQGFVRADGGAKARYIFYRPELFEQLSGGSFDIGDGRDTTWAKFRVRTTDRVFYFVDVHLDNGKDKAANARRARETDRMLAQMALINDTDKPMIYAGDFNSGTHRPEDAPGVKMRAAGLANARLLTKDVTNARINSGHTFSTSVLASGALIDHVWVTPDFEVDSWSQLVRITNGRYTTPVVSDHNAISAVVALDARSVSLGAPTPTQPLPATGTAPAAPAP
ncbi:fibronectin type III domain-containing protein [Aeromicrobium wangtongii]|uniref:Fibronectin type III domain-containing protein n=1 Tax=Aeromicrobium wangtongii TaxID=2969247 RepID=A0ABY5MED2_9ACTN|nr:fibronectin type III domain-containing protein [Aeromicrobium wangtongii]MCD9196676.1 fibronectin type III domain-containing protein [Aeromicrobium wangtongii]UUP14186.1 fibronectin type III domain-containing protein [Aeromicrobium wangtongii]